MLTLRGFVGLLLLLLLPASARAGSAVWRATNAKGQVIYLAGSMHSLRGIDYPLPPEYNRAFEASTRLVFEVEPGALERSSESMEKAGEYPRGDSLQRHVDPRTYEYLRRIFALLRVPEEKFARYRPWLLAFYFENPNAGGFSHDLGVEEFLTRRARTNGKATAGLESAREHADVFVGMSDVQAEATLLLTFVPQTEGASGRDVVAAWRRGDADFLWRSTRSSYRDYPVLADRLLEDRNLRWLPKIEGYLGGGRTTMIVVGAAHMGGPNGLLALLRKRGCRVEQL